MRAASRSSMTMCARSGRGSWCARTFQRTIYRPGELVQCDLWEPREQIPVGHGQTRRGWVVTAEVCWSRVIAGTLIFSKEAPDILWGLGRNLERLGALPEKLVWDREAAIAARWPPDRRVRRVLRAARGRLGDPRARATRRRRACWSARTGSCARTSSRAGGSRTTSTSRTAARRLVRQGQPAGASHDPRGPGRAARRGAGADAAAARPDAGRRPSAGDRGCRRSRIVRVDRNDYSIDPAFAGRRVEVRVSQTRGDRGRARHRRARLPAPARVRRRADDHRPGASDRARAPARPAPPAPRGRGRDPAACPAMTQLIPA